MKKKINFHVSNVLLVILLIGIYFLTNYGLENGFEHYIGAIIILGLVYFIGMPIHGE